MSEIAVWRRWGPDTRRVQAPTAFPEVMLAARAGDQSAFRQLWDSYAPAVARFARARGSREPEDLTSEVFLSVFRALPTFQGGEAAFKGFVFTVAHRRLVDELRARSRACQQSAWEDETDPRRSPSAEDGALGSLGSGQARQMLEGLAPDQRDVLVLRVFGDLTIDQIAEVLGKEPGAVKALQRRGLVALRKKLACGRTPARVAVDGSQ